MNKEQFEKVERNLIREIREVQRANQKMLEPLFKKLADIRATQPPAPIFVQVKFTPPWYFERIDEDSGDIRYEAHGPNDSFVIFNGPDALKDCSAFVDRNNDPTMVFYGEISKEKW